MFADPIEKSLVLHKSVNAKKTTENITIDGILSEQVWQESPSANVFIQRNPNEGKEASEKTELHIAYDDENIYLAARMYDDHPDSIIAHLTRRDNVLLSDRILIFFDSYHDKRSGYYFSINAAGTLTDGVLFNDDWDDNSWDAVWEGKSTVDKKGWVAEVKIPFSQLSFKDSDEQTWGFNLKRIIARKNEEDYLTRFPRNEGGFVSRFIELNGIKGIKPSTKIELVPYLTGKSEFTQQTPGNPFNNGSKYSTSLGADLKMGIGSNLTLNATINPDFGQVEIDPAVINLSDVETFYSEKRPFFVQGSSLFDFGTGGARNYWGFNWPGIDFFYSRRIGRVPQGSTPDADFADYPSGVHILGAAKLSGKLGDNWNIGTIHAVTNREYAKYSINGNKSQAEIEPLTYYGVARVQKEFNEGKQGLGFISTYTGRNYREFSLSDITNKNSVTGGIDGWTSLDSSKTWVFTGYTGFSNITGTPERMISIQENSQHYFQRPDAGHVKVDSNITSMTGFAGRYFLVKQKGNTFVNAAFGFITPKFDANDMGFFSRADVINWHAGGGYAWSDPTSYYRSAELGAAIFRSYDFDKNVTSQGIYSFSSYEFTNYYFLNLNLGYNFEAISNRRTRGGPLTKNPSVLTFSGQINSDGRNKLIFGLGYFTEQSISARSNGVDVSVEYHPAPNIALSISPSYSADFSKAQYLNTVDDPAAVNTFSKRYVFAELHQQTISAGIRLNWTFTPNLSLQLYMQPLISTGKYNDYKELAKSNSFDFNTYKNISYNQDNDQFDVIPENGGIASKFSISNPSFNYISLRGNAVLRWEYLPGSVFYFVWTQSRSDVDNTDEFRPGKSFNNMMDIHPDNIFAIKFTYWFHI